MKKLIIFILFCTVFIVTGCTKQKTIVNNVKQEIIPQAQTLDENRKKEVIENEVDTWQYYENKEAGFSLSFPPDVILGADDIDQAGEKYYLSWVHSILFRHLEVRWHGAGLPSSFFVF